MPVYASETRLAHLQQLRDRIDEEIRAQKKLIAAAQRRRDQQFKTRHRLRATNAAREAREDEDAQLRALAPTAAVRAWATANGITVGARGRIPQELRRQYLDAQPQPNNTLEEHQ